VQICRALRARNVLEELLDKVYVSENHTPAAVALQADGVEGVTKEPGVLAEGIAVEG